MPSKTDGFIRLILTMPFVQHAEKQGLDTRSALKALGLSQDMLRDPETAVHAEIVYGLCNELAEMASDPFFGCRVAEQFEIADWPPFVEAGRNSRTLGEFLCNLLMHVPQEASSVRHALTIEADCATYAVKRMIKTQNQPVQVEGFGAALNLRLLQSAGIDEWDPGELRLYTQFPEAVPRDYMGVKAIKSDERQMAIRFPPTWLHAPLGLDFAKRRGTRPNADLDLSIVAAVHSAARPLLANRELGANEIASRLGLGTKQLAAALRMNKTTAAREIKELRVDVAKTALLESEQTVADIGKSLGYADQSHFTRFFRSQTNMSPRDFRNGRQAKG